MIWIIWFIFAFFVAIYAKNRGHSAVLFFIIATLLSPLIGLIIALVIKPNEEELIHQGQLKRCPYCGEAVRLEAIVCKYCGKNINNFEFEENLDSKKELK